MISNLNFFEKQNKIWNSKQPKTAMEAILTEFRKLIA